MNITLKKDSWHFKIYSKVVSENAPKSLCPYFWIWAAMIIASPFLILFWLMGALTKLFESKPKPKKPMSEMTDEELEKEYERLNKKLKRINRNANIVLAVFGIVIAALLITSMYLGIKKIGWFNFFRNMFSVVGLVVTGYWTIDLISKNIKRIGDLNMVKVPLAMIKALYTKTCPIINWK